MAIRFYIPTALRAFTGGRSEVEVPAEPGTLRDALAALFAAHPGLADRVLTEAGTLRPHVNVFVGVDSCRGLGGLDASVPAGVEIAILPAVSGG